MRLTEQIYLKPSKELSNICHLSKNLYNLANYYIRQEYFNLNSWIRYDDLDYILKNKNPYRDLPIQTSQQILRLIDKNWKSFFNGIKEYYKDYKKFKAKPRIPNYKKKNGENIAIFTNQQCKIKDGLLLFPRKTHSKYSPYWLNPIKTRIRGRINEVRIRPLGIGYILEIVYEKSVINLGLNKERIGGIDIGENNIVAFVNNNGKKPFVIKGNIIKSINQFFNKKLAYYRKIEYKKGNFKDTKRIKKLYLNRNNKIHYWFHKISCFVIRSCVDNNIGSLIIGYNKGWKQQSNMGKKNNQNFVGIPFLKLVNMLKYKAELLGIDVALINEAYTSKCSFLDNESIKKHIRYNGRRCSRGLFKSKDGIIINADVNAGYNIIKKGFPNAFADGIEGVELHPCSVNLKN